MEGRQCKQREAGAPEACKEPTELGMALSDEARARGLPGDCTVDRSCTSATGHNPMDDDAYFVGAIVVPGYVTAYPLAKAGEIDAVRQVAVRRLIASRPTDEIADFLPATQAQQRGPHQGTIANPRTAIAARAGL